MYDIYAIYIFVMHCNIMTKELREKTFSFRMSHSEYAALVMISQNEERTPGAFLRALLNREITARTTQLADPTEMQ